MKNLLTTVRDFYPYYLRVHRNPTNRLLHVIGNIATLAYLVFMLLIIPNYLWLVFLILLVPTIIYPFAWVGHLFFEGNKPATWTMNPLVTKLCDWKMMKDTVTNRIPLSIELTDAWLDGHEFKYTKKSEHGR